MTAEEIDSLAEEKGLAFIKCRVWREIVRSGFYLGKTKEIIIKGVEYCPPRIAKCSGKRQKRILWIEAIKTFTDKRFKNRRIFIPVAGGIGG